MLVLFSSANENSSVMKIVNIQCDNEEFEIISSALQFSVQNMLSEDPRIICFIHLNDLNYENRKLLRQTINKYPSALLVISSGNDQIAKFAWKVNAFHFLSLPVSSAQLKTLKQKLQFNTRQSSENDKLKLPVKGGFDLIHPNEVCVIQGMGNYCQFYFREAKPKLYTARIGQVAEYLEFTPFICRINKSLIININHLTKIINGQAVFVGNPRVQINLSQRSVSAIKKELFWIE